MKFIITHANLQEKLNMIQVKRKHACSITKQNDENIHTHIYENLKKYLKFLRKSCKTSKITYTHMKKHMLTYKLL